MNTIFNPFKKVTKIIRQLQKKYVLKKKQLSQFFQMNPFSPFLQSSSVQHIKEEVKITQIKIDDFVHQYIFSREKRKKLLKTFPFLKRKSKDQTHYHGQKLVDRSTKKYTPQEQVVQYQDKKRRQEQPSVIVFSSSEISIQEKRKKETERRICSMDTLNSIINDEGFFTFFSKDSFNATKDAQIMASLLGKSEVPLELFFLALLGFRCEATKTMRRSGIQFRNLQHCFKLTKRNIFFFSPSFFAFFQTFRFSIKDLPNAWNDFIYFSKNNFFSSWNNSFIFSLNTQKQSFFLFEFKDWEKIFGLSLNKVNWTMQNLTQKGKKILSYVFPSFASSSNLPFSLELLTIFEKAACNTLYRFKSASISLEILLITFMEEESKVKRLIQLRLKDKISFYLLRYKLLKIVYKTEVAIRRVPRGHRIFIYCVKNNSSDKQFRKLIRWQILELATASFRDAFVKQVLNADINYFDWKNYYNSTSFPSIRNSIAFESEYLSNVEGYPQMRKEVVELLQKDFEFPKQINA